MAPTRGRGVVDTLGGAVVVSGHEVHREEKVRIEPRGDSEGGHKPRERFRHTCARKEASAAEAFVVRFEYVFSSDCAIGRPACACREWLVVLDAEEPPWPCPSPPPGRNGGGLGCFMCTCARLEGVILCFLRNA